MYAARSLASSRPNCMSGIFGCGSMRNWASLSALKPGIFDGGERGNVVGAARLVGRNDMAGGAPLLGNFSPRLASAATAQVSVGSPSVSAVSPPGQKGGRSRDGAENALS
jgi:hypothetical protein